MLAKAAASVNVPSIMSGSSMTSPETISKEVPDNPWYQLYAARDSKITDDFIRRAKDCGFQTLVLTVDNPVFPKLERDKRNGFSIPFVSRYQSWSMPCCIHAGPLNTCVMAAANDADLEALRPARCEPRRGFGFPPQPESVRPDLARPRPHPPPVARKSRRQGLARASDAQRAANAGVEGVLVSNHGGKTLDRAPQLSTRWWPLPPRW